MPAPRSIDGMPLIGPERLEFFDEIQLTGNQYHGRTYANIAVNGPGLATGYDPDIKAEVTHLAMQWNGVNPLPGGGTTFDIAATKRGAEALGRDQIRRLIDSMHIGSAALQRIPEQLQEAQRSIELTGDIGMALLDHLHQMVGAPLGVLQISRVVESMVIPAGEHVAHLWYPAMMPPTGVLDRMRRNLRDMIVAEAG